MPLAFIISLFVAALGVMAIISPPRLGAVVRLFRNPPGFYTAAAIRLVWGAALILAAPTSRAPEAVRIVGIIVLATGLIMPFFGRERFRRLLDWWSTRGPAFTRVWGIFALTFGLLLAYAVFL